jgi:hypothetical protein
MPLLVGGSSLMNIIEEQYFLANKVNISISDSNNMVDFERTVFVNILLTELKKKKEAMKK